MTGAGPQQPDITLVLDMDGVIRHAALSATMAGESVDGWLGRSWTDVAATDGDKVKRMIEDARSSGVSAFRQINQRFPSGVELPMEFTTMVLGDRTGMLVVGKNIQAVAELHARLIAAQQAIERDYWRLREVETRYRLVFDSTNEAVILLSATDLRIVEANAAATLALGTGEPRSGSLIGRDILNDTAVADRDALRAMLLQVRERGKALSILVHFGLPARPWMVRGSLMPSEKGQVLLLHFAPASLTTTTSELSEQATIKALIDRVPDGFVAVDPQGFIRHANAAFLELVQVGAKGSVIGESLGRWLSAPGADHAALLTQVRRHTTVRLFRTTLRGELGSESEIEISAVRGDERGDQEFVGLLLRNVSRRLDAPENRDLLRSALERINEQLGKSSLRKLVKETVSIVEQHYVREALELTRGNRTATAELLGLSRQSLYAKLNRYGLDDREPESQDISED